MLSEISQKERQILYDFIYMWNLEKKPNSQKQRIELWLPGGEVRETQVDIGQRV